MRFDLDTYTRIVAPVDVVDIDFGAFRDQPLDAATLRCLRYMHDIESHTICYLRDILVTKAHRDSEMTTFLTMWSYEEHWHGEALAAVLRAHDEAGGRSRVADVRGSATRWERWRPIAFMGASAVLPDVTAVSVTWGAVNEWTTQAGYARLGALSGHPVLQELLRRIMKQEGRHIDFYATEATRRLVRSKGAQRTTRFALRHVWSPVGTGVRPQEEVDFVVRHLFSGTEGAAMADRIDRRIDRLPGLAGLNLVTGARRASLERAHWN